MPIQQTLLKEILAIPTVPYREKLVLDRFGAELAQEGVPHFQDAKGNLVIGAESGEQYQRKLSAQKSEPVRIFIAHTDHPGFHAEKWDAKGRLHVRWHGGSPTKQLEGARVWIANETGYCDEGRLTDIKMHKSGMYLETAKVKGLTRVSPQAVDAKTLWGAFQFRKPVWKAGSLYYTKAADDLVGSFVIVTLAIALWKKDRESFDHFIGLLTRAEEVGFIGCLAHFELGYFKAAKRPLLAVSLETSRTLPGAIVGKGPVVRLGDRASIFDPKSLEILTSIAKKWLPNKFQRRVMDGGTCEGTVATVFGIPTVGISIPLGNYHNQNFEGGPDARGKLGPAPEFVHTKDIEGMYALCNGLMERGLEWSNPFTERERQLIARLKEAEALLAACL